MPEVKQQKTIESDSEPLKDKVPERHNAVVPEYEPVTVQLKHVTDIFGQNIDRFSKTMPSIGRIEIQKEWVFVWPSEAPGSRLCYEKIPMTAVRKIKYQECVKEAT